MWIYGDCLDLMAEIEQTKRDIEVRLEVYPELIALFEPRTKEQEK